METLLEARDVGKRYPGVVALDGVSLALRPGRVHAVVGENGAGKSTLMKILSGAETPDAGDVIVRGKRAVFAGTRDAESAGIAMIHQELELVPALGVGENVFLGREPTRFGLVDFATMRHDAAAILARLGHAIDPRVRVETLSIGDRQLVEIAKALARDTSVIIMDEPTTALADDDVERLFAIVRTLTAHGAAVVYVSHKMDELFRIADEITVLRDGRLVGHRESDATDAAELIRMMVGRELASAANTRRNVDAPTVLRVRDLETAAHGAHVGRSLSGISFDLHAGEVLGVAGLLGAGRTELLECLFGARAVGPATAIELDGRRVGFASPRDAIRSGIALVTEDRKDRGLVPDLDVGRNVTLAVLDRFTRAGFVRRADEAIAARGAVERLRVKATSIDATMDTLSGGNQQKVVLAKWLMTSPKVLLLDEPTKGIDVAAKAEIAALVRMLAADGMAVVLASSELPELLALADRILILREGRLAGALERDAATPERILELATSTVAA